MEEKMVSVKNKFFTREICVCAHLTQTRYAQRTCAEMRIKMLRLSVKDEEFLMIGDDVKIVFLGSSGGQTRIMIDAPKEINIARSKAIEKRIKDPDLLATIPKYHKNLEKQTKPKSKTVIVKNQ